MHVLVVDDSENDFFFIERSLKKTRGLTQIDWAGTANSAVQMLQSSSSEDLPDLIVSDTSMPGMTGVEFVTWLKSDSKFQQITTVVLSGTISRQKLLDLEKAGADHICEKPCQIPDWDKLAEHLFNFCVSETASVTMPNQLQDL